MCAGFNNLGDLFEQMMEESVANEAKEKGISVDEVKKARKIQAEQANAEFELKRKKEVQAEKEALDRLNALSDLPFRFHVGVAYHPRQGPNMHGSQHIVLNQDFEFGRLKRKTHNALCRSKDFWGLEYVHVLRYEKIEDVVDCPRCIQQAKRIINKI